MNTQLDYHIERLRQRHGSYTRVAKHIGIDPRSFRRGRNGRMAKPAERIILASGRLLSLQLLLRELVRTGDLKPSALNRAWRKTRDAGVTIS